MQRSYSILKPSWNFLEPRKPLQRAWCRYMLASKISFQPVWSELLQNIISGAFRSSRRLVSVLQRSGSVLQTSWSILAGASSLPTLLKTLKTPPRTRQIVWKSLRRSKSTPRHSLKWPKHVSNANASVALSVRCEHVFANLEHMCKIFPQIENALNLGDRTCFCKRIDDVLVGFHSSSMACHRKVKGKGRREEDVRPAVFLNSTGNVLELQVF